MTNEKQTLKIKKPPYEQGLENEEKVMKAVRWFGHLRHTDLALAVWPNSKPKSGAECARRTCLKLIKRGYLIRRRNTFGSSSYVLSARGAAYLTSLGWSCSSGSQIQSVSGPFFRHRTMTTQYLLSRRNLAPDEAVFGENALAKNWFYLDRDQLAKSFGKLPDAVVVVPGHKRGFNRPGDVVVDWVETECTFKAMPELQKVLEMGWQLGGFLGASDEVTLDRLIIVVDDKDRHEAAIIRAFKAVLAQKPISDKEALKSLMESIIIVRANTGVEMHWQGFEEVNLLNLIKRFPERKRSKLLPEIF